MDLHVNFVKYQATNFELIKNVYLPLNFKVKPGFSYEEMLKQINGTLQQTMLLELKVIKLLFQAQKAHRHLVLNMPHLNGIK